MKFMKEQALRQSLAPGPEVTLDKVEFVCPGGAPQVLYFNYSTDPALRALDAPPAASAPGAP